MKHRCSLPFLVAFSLLAVSLRAEETESKVPYDSVSYAMSALKGQIIDGVECVPFFLKSTKEGEPIDAKRANFRIRMADGTEVSLKVGLLSDIPEEKRSDIDKKYIDDGYTHILWVPKANKRFVNGHLVNSLPKGSIEMSQAFWMLKNSRQLEQDPTKPGEQAGAGQPTIVPEPKPVGKDKPQPEAKPAPR